MDEKEKAFKAYQADALEICIQLGYPKECYKELLKAKTEEDISRILHTARDRAND